MGRRPRRRLADLIGEVGAAPLEHEGGGREGVVPGATPEAREGAAATPAAPRVPPRIPKYLALERKEARLRGDQMDSLASLARRVNRRKPWRGGERITENTLIRVAVDWLLSQEAHVGGSTEEEIRRSLGVSGPRFGTDA
jgi:hypothetical protein